MRRFHISTSISVSDLTISSILEAAPWHLAIGGCLLTMLLSFVGLFWIPGLLVARQLRRVTKEVLEATASADLGPIFEPYRRLKHLWSEFRETLHEERAFNSRT